jgi:hypothetical protein
MDCPLFMANQIVADRAFFQAVVNIGNTPSGIAENGSYPFLDQAFN